ncbi:MAG: hypothetical protein IPO17_04255 [Flavobacteriales bacterium]|nr:hypothetical protein [Flavobacteriales bacterium]
MPFDIEHTAVTGQRVAAGVEVTEPFELEIGEGKTQGQGQGCEQSARFPPPFLVVVNAICSTTLLSTMATVL